MDALPREIVINILLQATYKDVLKFSLLSTIANQIFNNKIFWLDKAHNDFGTSQVIFENTSLTPNKRYLELLTTYLQEKISRILGNIPIDDMSEERIPGTFHLNIGERISAETAILIARIPEVVSLSFELLSFSEFISNLEEILDHLEHIWYYGQWTRLGQQGNDILGFALSELIIYSIFWILLNIPIYLKFFLLYLSSSIGNQH